MGENPGAPGRDGQNPEIGIEGDGDTIYSISPDATTDVAHTTRVVFSGTELQETNAFERRQQVLKAAQKKAQVRKKSARFAVAVLDNRDAFLGPLERVFWLVFAELARRGDYLPAGLVGALAVVFWRWKPDRPGPLVGFMRQDSETIRKRLISFTQTIYKG